MDKALKPSAACVNLVKSFESCRLKAYDDGVGVWTIGYGHTRGVRRGMVITQPQADAFLNLDLLDAVTAVEKAITHPLQQREFDALVSFTFNVGGAALASSTLARKLNAGNVAGAGAEFSRWNKAGKPPKPMLGLTRRREAERLMFLGISG